MKIICRQMVPFVPYVLLYSMKTLFGMESINALPSLLFSDEALMQLVGVNAQQVRQGICRRGATKRQGERLPGPICPDTLGLLSKTLARLMVFVDERQRLAAGARRTVQRFRHDEMVAGTEAVLQNCIERLEQDYSFRINKE